ncbi:MAG: hypothetical protein WCY28_03165 [Candidatus Shapirobacteria bacterium]|jgi:hypothetical protein
MQNNNQKRITFKRDTDPNDVIMEILKNNGFSETLDEYIEKTDKNIEPWFDTLYQSGKKLFIGDITDDDFLTVIQKKLNTTEKISKEILNAIKKNLFSIARILEKEELETEQEINASPKMKPPIKVAEFLEKSKPKMPEKKIIENQKKDDTLELTPRQKSRLPLKSTPENSVPKLTKKQNNKPDKYRENI